MWGDVGRSGVFHLEDIWQWDMLVEAEEVDALERLLELVVGHHLPRGTGCMHTWAQGQGVGVRVRLRVSVSMRVRGREGAFGGGSWFAMSVCNWCVQ